MLLHILNRSPATSLVYRQALAAMGDEDRLLLIEDAVQGVLPGLYVHFAALDGRLFVLEEDLAARGLASRCPPDIRKVDVEGFVALTEEAQRTVSWY